MSAITQTTQLDTFSLIRAAIKANSTLSAKFNDSNIYEFEPKHKGNKQTHFPYIWVDVPSLSADTPSFDNSFSIKELEANAVLRMEWHARDNFTTYANAFIKAIEDYEDTFDASGYYDVECEYLGNDPNQVIDQKEIVEAAFRISFQGKVQR